MNSGERSGRSTAQPSSAHDGCCPQPQRRAFRERGGSPPKSAHYATLARRCAAVGIDLLLGLPILVLVLVATDAASGFSLYKYDLAVRASVLYVVVCAVYFACWESSPARATPGKIFLGLCVGTADDKPISFADAMIRFFLVLAAAVPLNAGAWAAWRDPRGRGLHDRFCRTVVLAHHVSPGRLRSIVRLPRIGDVVTAIVTSAIAYALVFHVAPTIARNLAIADRFDAAIVEVTQPDVRGDAVGPDGRWIRMDAATQASLDDLGLDGEIDPQSGDTKRRYRDPRVR